MVNNLRSTDTVSIVVYGGSVGIWLPPTSGSEKDKIHDAIEELEPGGATAGESGIRTAYRVAKSKFIANGNNRVILATDGDFNVGQTSEEDLERLITGHRQMGIYLTCLGVGMGNYKDSKLEVLAKKGNGNFSYLDNEKEAEKVLVKELTQTMYAVADDALLHVSFQPDRIRSYRLIGFDNKVAALSDTSSVLEGGEVGSGHTQIAIFEVETNTDSTNTSSDFAIVELTYKLANDSIPRKIQQLSTGNPEAFHSLPVAYRFATGVALFGSILKDSKFTRSAGFPDVQAIVQPLVRPDNYLEQEFLALVEKAKKIYTKGKPTRSRGGLR
jgi:Ca-activated chloride channel family protein